MRDLKKEIENAKKMLALGGKCDFPCNDCPMYGALLTYNLTHPALVGMTNPDDYGPGYVAAEKRWLRGWLSLATGKPVKE